MRIYSMIDQVTPASGDQRAIKSVEVNGTPNRIRTCDLLIKSQLLYQLSYGRIRTAHIVECLPGVNAFCC